MAGEYQITLVLAGSGTVAANLGGVGNTGLDAAVGREITVFAITVLTDIGTSGYPLSVYRATGVAAGTLVTAANIPKLDTAGADAALEVRTGAVTGTKSAQRLAILGGGVSTGGTGNQNFWTGKLRLRANEGLILDQSPLAESLGTVDTYWVTITWGET